MRVRERTTELEAATASSTRLLIPCRTTFAPLRAVDGYARMLEEDYGERPDAEGSRMLGVVRASSQRMAHLIDDLLAFSRLGREPLRTLPVRLDELVKQVIDETRSENGGRSIEFAVGDLGTVDADPALLKQAFANLLRNAIKFTSKQDHAAIEVGCRAENGPSELKTYYVKTTASASIEVLRQAVRSIPAAAQCRRVPGNRRRARDRPADHPSPRGHDLGGVEAGRRRDLLLYASPRAPRHQIRGTILPGRTSEIGDCRQRQRHDRVATNQERA